MKKFAEVTLLLDSFIQECDTSVDVTFKFCCNPFGVHDNNFYSLFKSTNELLHTELLFRKNGFVKATAYQQLSNSFTEMKNMRKQFDESEFFASMAKEGEELLAKLGLNVDELDDDDDDDVEGGEVNPMSQEDTSDIGDGAGVFPNETLVRTSGGTFEIEGRGGGEVNPIPQDETFETEREGEEVNPIPSGGISDETFEVEKEKRTKKKRRKKKKKKKRRRPHQPLSNRC